MAEIYDLEVYKRNKEATMINSEQTEKTEGVPLAKKKETLGVSEIEDAAIRREKEDSDLNLARKLSEAKDSKLLTEVRERLKDMAREKDTVDKNAQNKYEKDLGGEMTPEEKAEKEKMREFFEKELGNLYESLPHDKKMKKEEVVPHIGRTELNLTPLVVKKLSEIISREKLNLEEKDLFVKKSLEVLEINVHIRALGQASGQVIDRLIQERLSGKA